MRIASCTVVMQACRLALPSTVTRQSKQTPMRQYGPRGAPETAVVRQATCPEASIAAATVSPCRAGVAVPSIKIVRESSRSLITRRNIESPCAESSKAIVRQIAYVNAGRQEECVGRRQCHAAMTGGDERAGASLRLIVDRITILGHHAQCRPAPHHVQLGQMREHSDGALGHYRENLAANGDIEPSLLHRIADHDAAFVGLTYRVHHVIHEGRDLLGDDDLAALRTHWRTNSDHRSQPRIAKSSGEHDFVRRNFDVGAMQPELAATRLDSFHCAVGKISAAMPLKT